MRLDAQRRECSEDFGKIGCASETAGVQVVYRDVERKEVLRTFEEALLDKL
jgi:hypothetical protein